MPLVKKRSQLQLVQYLIKYLQEQLTNMLIREHVLLLLLQLIRREQRLLIQQWTSPSTMRNSQRMRRYRQSCLVNLLGGTVQDMYSMTWSQPDKCVIDQLYNLKTVQRVQEQ